MMIPVYIYIFLLLLFSVVVLKDFLRGHNFIEVKEKNSFGVYSLILLSIFCVFSLIYGGFFWW